MFFKLFSDCIPVKGCDRSAIYDLTRNEFHLIPSILYDILQKTELNTVDKIKEFYGTENSVMIDEYFQFLNERELLMWDEESDFERFSPLNVDWDHPGILSNAVIELPSDIEMFSKTVRSLESCGVRYVALYVEELSSHPLSSYLEKFEQSSISGIDVILTTPAGYDSVKNLEAIVDRFARINLVKIFCAKENSMTTTNHVPIEAVAHSFDKSLNSFRSDPKKFMVNTMFFSEAKLFNVHFNRKVCIDKSGNIRNSLFHDRVFGNIINDDLSAIVATPQFQSLWYAKKDDTIGCRDCEFRYMCNDMRVPVKSNEGWVHTSECGYDPYVGKWKTEDGHQPLNENCFA